MAPRILICGAFMLCIHLDSEFTTRKNAGDIVWAHEEVKEMFDNTAEVIVSTLFLKPIRCHAQFSPKAHGLP
jgi:hypothetical protein